MDRSEPSTSAKVAFLSSVAAHGGTGPVEVRETHMAWVFLVGTRAYKMKKPVRHPFLDYTTLAARRHVCAEEVRLNRRLAPDVYLGVAKLTATDDGGLAINGKGRIVDWLVEMQRLPETLMLDRAIEAGTVSRRRIDAVADLLGAFYTGAPPLDIDPDAHMARIGDELRRDRGVFAHEVFAHEALAALAARGAQIATWLEAVVADRGEVVRDRVTGRRVVEGHGDLRPEHVCLSDPPVIIDCLEFSRDLRCVDPFDEIAFLSMECAVLRARWIGPVLRARVAAALGDRPPDALFAFYTARRACLRARQTLAHLLDPAPRTPTKWAPLAAAYMDEAEAALVSLRPR